MRLIEPCLRARVRCLGAELEQTHARIQRLLDAIEQHCVRQAARRDRIEPGYALPRTRLPGTVRRETSDGHQVSG